MVRFDGIRATIFTCVGALLVGCFGTQPAAPTEDEGGGDSPAVAESDSGEAMPASLRQALIAARMAEAGPEHRFETTTGTGIVRAQSPEQRLRFAVSDDQVTVEPTGGGWEAELRLTGFGRLGAVEPLPGGASRGRWQPGEPGPRRGDRVVPERPAGPGAGLRRGRAARRPRAPRRGAAGGRGAATRAGRSRRVGGAAPGRGRPAPVYRPVRERRRGPPPVGVDRGGRSDDPAGGRRPGRGLSHHHRPAGGHLSADPAADEPPARWQLWRVCRYRRRHRGDRGARVERWWRPRSGGGVRLSANRGRLGASRDADGGRWGRWRPLRHGGVHFRRHHRGGCARRRRGHGGRPGIGHGVRAVGHHRRVDRDGHADHDQDRRWRPIRGGGALHRRRGWWSARREWTTSGPGTLVVAFCTPAAARAGPRPRRSGRTPRRRGWRPGHRWRSAGMCCCWALQAMEWAWAPWSPSPTILEHGARRSSFTLRIDSGGAAFGASLALDRTIVIGAPLHDVDGAENQGEAYVFTYNRLTDEFSERAILTAGSAMDRFGYDVDISRSTLVVGAPYDTFGGVGGRGVAHIFVDEGGMTWTSTAHLSAADAAMSDHLGSSVAIDGDTAVAGAYFAGSGGPEHDGAAYVFVSSGGAMESSSQAHRHLCRRWVRELLWQCDRHRR